MALAEKHHMKDFSRAVGKMVAVAAMACTLPAAPAFAGNCLPRATSFDLNSDTVHWSFSIRASTECLQGLRGGAMLLDEVEIVEPPSTGSLTISGPAFFYRAPALGQSDRFRLRVTGEKNRMRGSSELVVEVSVR